MAVACGFRRHSDEPIFLVNEWIRSGQMTNGHGVGEEGVLLYRCKSEKKKEEGEGERARSKKEQEREISKTGRLPKSKSVVYQHMP